LRPDSQRELRTMLKIARKKSGTKELGKRDFRRGREEIGDKVMFGKEKKGDPAH